MSKMHPHIHTAPFSLTMFRLCLHTLIYTQVTSFCPQVLTLRSFQSLIGINLDGIHIIGSIAKLGGPRELAKNGSQIICL
jgi:hypothetical protein